MARKVRRSSTTPRPVRRFPRKHQDRILCLCQGLTSQALADCYTPLEAIETFCLACILSLEVFFDESIPEKERGYWISRMEKRQKPFLQQLLQPSETPIAESASDSPQRITYREETLLAPRVRMDARYGTPSFFWERTVRHAYPLTARQPQKPSRTRTYTAYIPRKGSRQKEKMRVYLLSKHIPVVKKTSSVPDSVFDSEPAWAQTAAHLIEPELTELRKQAKAVSRLSQAVMRASAAFAKNTL